MKAAKTGIIAEFVTGYLQREIRLVCTVAGGTDKGVRDAKAVGYGVGRLVKIADGAITAPTGVSATSIGDATHIIAQSDDTIREGGHICGDPEKYSSLPNLVCENSTEAKTVAVYKIVDPDDIKLIDLDAGKKGA